ncbi:MAG: GNAT family N-acetyltransferase [Microthrixaceae bacterium]|nr:GNAT family N-acetyltransferase [Microthrixaceae bacterium]
MIGARRSAPEDHAAIAELRHLAGVDILTIRGGAHLTEGVVPAMEQDSPGSEPAVVVGLIGGDVIGVATVVRDRHRAILTELFTHPEARGVGVGHAMLAEVTEVARSWNCTDLDSFALPGDRETKNFFESHDMKARLLVVHRSL